MIAQKFRTPRQRISYAMSKGFNLKSELFIVKFLENKQPHCRFRVIVSKKIHPKAVKRNHLRSQIYEALRTGYEETGSNHLDLILIPKKNILKADYKSISENISKLKLHL